MDDCSEMSLRVEAIIAGINLDDLKPSIASRWGNSKKSRIEADMYDNGFRVEDLKMVEVDEELVKMNHARDREKKAADLKHAAMKEGIRLDDLTPHWPLYESELSMKSRIELGMNVNGFSVEDLKKINLDDEREKRKEEKRHNQFTMLNLIKWMEKNNIQPIPPKNIHPYNLYKDVIDSHLNKEEETIKKQPGHDLDQLILRHGLQDILKDDPFRYKKIIDYHWKYIKDELTVFSMGVFESPVNPPPLATGDAIPEFLLQDPDKKTHHIGDSSYNKDPKKQKLMEDDHDM